MPVLYRHYMNELEEAADIATTIKDLTDSGVQGGECAILVRTNVQTRAHEAALRALGVPYKVFGLGFWDRSATRAVTGYLKIVAGVGGDDGLQALLDCINKPTRYLANRSAEAAAQSNADDPVMGLLSAGSLNSRQRASAATLCNLVTEVRGKLASGEMSVEDATNYIAKTTGLDHYLMALPADSAESEEDDGQLSVLTEVAIASRSDEFPTIQEFVAYIISQEMGSRERDKIDPNKVIISTVHRAKGMEWEVVFVAGVAAGILPHKRSMFGTALEEERRVFYVAVTRAIEYCIISGFNYYQDKDAGLSPFIAENPPEGAFEVSGVEESVAA